MLPLPAGGGSLSLKKRKVMRRQTGRARNTLAPLIVSLLTPDRAVQQLGVRVLRIEVFAEPLYAVSIAAAGAMRGAGDTLIPSLLNWVSMWGVRISAAALLAPRLGLAGVWLAMCLELCVRGALFLARLLKERWLAHDLSGN